MLLFLLFKGIYSMMSHVLIFTGAPKIKKTKVFNEIHLTESDKDQTVKNNFVWKTVSFSNYELHSNLVEKFSQESEELSQLTLLSSNSHNINSEAVSKTNENVTLRSNNTLTGTENNYYDCSQLLFSHQDKDSNLSVNTVKENDTEVVGETPLSMLKHSSTDQGK